jgi:hypothetical protein
MCSNLISGKKRVTKEMDIIIKINFIFGERFLKSSMKPIIKKRVPRINIILEKLSSKITLSKPIICRKKIIKYKFRRIIKPPIIDTDFLCFFNFPSGLSKKIRF